MKKVKFRFPGNVHEAAPVKAATGRGAAGASKYPATPTHGEIKVGYSPKLVVVVANKLGISPASLARRIGVSHSTFHRKLNDRVPLTEHESDSLARHSALLSQAVAVFDGDEDAAKRWIACPQVGLGNAIPLDLAQTSFGFREVEKLLTRIDHGVYA